MLPREYRLRHSQDFARVRREGRAWSHAVLVITAAPNGGPVSRVGFSVGKRLGKACVRNRVRRLLREAVRAHLGELKPGYDLVIIGRPALVGLPLSAVEASVQRMLRQAHLTRTDTGT